MDVGGDGEGEGDGDGVGADVGLDNEAGAGDGLYQQSRRHFLAICSTVPLRLLCPMVTR